MATIATLPRRRSSPQQSSPKSVVDKVDGRSAGTLNRVEVSGLATLPRSGASTLAIQVILCLAVPEYADLAVVVGLVKEGLVHGEVHVVVHSDLLDLDVVRPHL